MTDCMRANEMSETNRTKGSTLPKQNTKCSDFAKAIEEAKTNALPYESWVKLDAETALAYSAFCVFRDLGAERTIRKAVEITEPDKNKWERRYNVWRGWASDYRWRERAADYDRHIEKLKLGELRKTIEAQGEMHRATTRKMFEVVQKKLDTMNPEELTQGNVTEWVQTAIKADREAAGLVSPGGKEELKQGELNFVSDFQGL
jgi:hypothetical protein